VSEMARVLVGYRHFYWTEGADQTKAGEKLSSVLNERAKTLGLFGIGRVVSKQVTVLFHHRAAARGVDDDRIDIGTQKRVYVLPRHLLSCLAFAVVNVQRAATCLALRKYDFASVALQHTDGSFIHLAKEQWHDTSVKQGNFSAVLTDGRMSA